MKEFIRHHLIAMIWIGILLVVLAFCSISRQPRAEQAFPSVAEFEQQFGLARGSVLPKAVLCGQRACEVHYESGKELAPGRYSVVLQLVPLK